MKAWFFAVLAAAAGTPDAGADGDDAGGVPQRQVDDVKAEVNRHIAEIERCYEAELASDPCADGTVWLSFEIETDGRVTWARAVWDDRAPDRDLVTCIEERSRAWRFTKLPHKLDVRYPFRFSLGVPPAPSASCGAGLLAVATYAASGLPGSFDAPGWLAICAAKGASDVRPVKVSAVPVFDELLDHPPMLSGRRIVVAGCSRPVALFRNVFSVRAGRVPTAKVVTRKGGEDRTIDLTLGAAHYHLRVHSGAGPEQLLLTEGGLLPQRLATWFDPPYGWRVVWAGDLDGDGRPDFVLEDGFEEGLRHLYMSRAAGPGQYVRDVAWTEY